MSATLRCKHNVRRLIMGVFLFVKIVASFSDVHVLSCTQIYMFHPATVTILNELIFCLLPQKAFFRHESLESYPHLPDLDKFIISAKIVVVANPGMGVGKFKKKFQKVCLLSFE